ncbi:MAG: hypothetical protein WCK28_10805 [Burkholderiales bacterium]|jgi:hypothetical protein
MPGYLVPLLHLAALVALGALVRNRLMVLAVSLGGGAWLALTMHPSDLQSMSVEGFATTFGGIVTGAIVGLWAAGMHARETRADRIAREIATGKSGRTAPSRPKPRTGPLTRVVAAMLATVAVAVAAVAGLYVEGSTVPAVRTTVDAWRATPTARAVGLGPVQPAAPAAKAGAAAGTKPGERAAAGGSDRPRVRTGAPGERPSGDMRHCLERGGSSQDVLRCAEQGR